MRTTYQITEYGSFISGKKVDGFTTLPENTFAQLENFILSNANKDTDALELMTLSAKKGIGKVITAKNYVGIIAMTDGTTIEILPKIYSKVKYDLQEVKKLLFDMLRTLRNSLYKSLQITSVDIEKMNIFEIFIRMFIDEVFLIVKRGLKNGYEAVERNEGVVKGKIIFPKQIRYNYAHRERMYVEYDEFNINRSENKLIKSTLLYLYRQTTVNKNKKDLKTLLNVFGEVEPSTDYESDCLRFVPDRNMKDYSNAIQWCRVFLLGKSFTSFSGSEVAFALLFPMETLFESYIAVQIHRALDLNTYRLTAQDKSYHLFDLPSRKFLMKPDLVIRHKESKKVLVMDTKWKVLVDGKANYGISQADMYQMFAYQKKYHAESVTLLYPLTEKVRHNKNIEFRANDATHIKVRFIDLFDLNNSLSNLIAEIRAETDEN